VVVTFPALDGFTNPVVPSAGGAANGSVATSLEPAVAGVITPAITNVVGSPDAVSVVTATPSIPGANASYTLSTNIESNLTQGVSTFTVTLVESTNFAATGGYGLPTTISRSNIVISGNTCDVGAPVAVGGPPAACAANQISQSQNPPSDPAVDTNAGTITFTVPDMNPGNQGTAGHNLQAGTVTINISASAGITNPTGASTSKRMWISDSTDPLSPLANAPGGPDTRWAAAPVLPRVIQLNDVEDKRGTVVTVNGFGFSAPSVTIWLDNNPAGVGGVNNDIIDTGEPTLASGVPVSGGKFSTMITITSAFKSGGANFIQAMDASGTQGATRAVATNFVLDPSVASVTPTSGSIATSMTAQLQDYPALDNFSAIKVAGVTVPGGNLVTVGNIAADGTASWTFTVPAGTTQGPNSVSFISANPITGNTHSASKTITVNSASIIVTPTTVVPGQQVTITGSSFTGSTAIVSTVPAYTGIQIGSAYMTTTGTAVGPAIPPVTQTDSGGNMVVQFKVPTQGPAAITSPGTYTVIVTDASLNNVNGTATITVPTPTLTISPSTGLAGSTITYSGSGFAASQTVTITYPAAGGNQVTASVQADSSGNYSGTMTIPNNGIVSPSTNTVTATALGGVETASAIHNIPSAALTISQSTAAPGQTIMVTGANFPIFTSVSSICFGTNSVSLTGVNTDGNGTFTANVLIPGLSPGTTTVLADVGGTAGGNACTFVGGVTANTPITISSAPVTVPATLALAGLVNTQNLNIVTSFSYSTSLYQAYVPNLAGNTLVNLSPNTVIFITMTKDTTVVVSGIPYPVKANIPTPIGIGAAVSITVQ